MDILRRLPCAFGALLAALALSGQCGANAPNAPVEIPDSVPAEYGMSAQEIGVARARAAKGSRSSSIRLSNYYAKVEQDTGEWMFWLRLASEQGDCVSIVSLARHLAFAQENHDGSRRWIAFGRLKNCGKVIDDVPSLLRLEAEK